MTIWNNQEYYRKIAAGEDFSHPGFKLAKDYCWGAGRILDVGCGDGSKLAKLGNQRTRRVGCDVSKEAVILGKQKFPGIKFDQLVGDVLPYKDDLFDRVTSFFVLEHTEDPEALVKEMIRVLAPGGEIIFLAPNFGAPNRASPNSRESRIKKLVLGLLKDLMPTDSGLGWAKVRPRISSIEEFASDLDTTIEPYLGSLGRFCKRHS